MYSDKLLQWANPSRLSNCPIQTMKSPACCFYSRLRSDMACYWDSRGIYLIAWILWRVQITRAVNFIHRQQTHPSPSKICSSPTSGSSCFYCTPHLLITVSDILHSPSDGSLCHLNGKQHLLDVVKTSSQSLYGKEGPATFYLLSTPKANLLCY